MEGDSHPQIWSLILSHKSTAYFLPHTSWKPPSSFKLLFFIRRGRGRDRQSWLTKVTAMDWCRGDRIDDVIVAKDQCAWSGFSSQEPVQQWGANNLSNGTADEGDFSCESFMNDFERDHLVCGGNQAENSGVRGGTSESSIYWSALLNNQDYQQDGLTGTNQTDENFMNSLLTDDVCVGEHFQFYDSSQSQGTCSDGNNLTSDMLLDSTSDLYNMQEMGSYEHLNVEEFPYLLDCKKNQSDNHYNFSNMMSNAIPQYNTPVGNVRAPPQQAFESRRDGDQPSVEETVLQEFGSAMQKMTDESRLCFRDALYRLASNSEKHSRNQGQHVDDLLLEEPSARTAEREACEARTNTIDRAIADMMFNKPYLSDSDQPFKQSIQQCAGPTPGDAEVPHHSRKGNAT